MHTRATKMAKQAVQQYETMKRQRVKASVQDRQDFVEVDTALIHGCEAAHDTQMCI
jgi:hypothetical protein